MFDVLLEAYAYIVSLALQLNADTLSITRHRASVHTDNNISS